MIGPARRKRILTGQVRHDQPGFALELNLKSAYHTGTLLGVERVQNLAALVPGTGESQAF